MSIIYINPYTFAADTVGDPYFFSVSTLLHLDGTNGSTTFTDTSPLPKTVTAVGSAQISTAEAQFDQSLLLNDANTYTNYLTTPDNAGFQMGTGDFTVEAWIYLISKPRNTASIISSGSSDFGNNGGYFVVDSSNRIQLGLPGFAVFGGTISTGQWYHVAGTRSGTTTRIFINGTLTSTGTGDSNNYNFSKDNLLIGRDGWDSSGNQGFHGYIDDVRITKGVARYTDTFSVPNAPFPNSYGAVAPDIVTDGMLMNLDAGNALSYPGSGTTWTDLTLNGNNGTLTGFSGSFYDSANQGSLIFDGNNDFAACGSVNFFGSGKVTANAWVKLSGSKVQHIIDSSSTTWHLAVLDDNRPYFWNGTTYHQAAPALSLNQWYMLTGVQGTTLDIYVNGVLQQSIATNVNVATGNNISVGNFQGSPATRYWNGNIATATLYNRALTAAEILQNFNALRGRFGL